MQRTEGKIDQRSDVRAHEGARKYSGGPFADPPNKKFPIDTGEHILAAWSYINNKDYASRYEPREVTAIIWRIKHAARKHGVVIPESLAGAEE